MSISTLRIIRFGDKYYWTPELIASQAASLLIDGNLPSPQNTGYRLQLRITETISWSGSVTSVGVPARSTTGHRYDRLPTPRTGKAFLFLGNTPDSERTRMGGEETDRGCLSGPGGFRRWGNKGGKGRMKGAGVWSVVRVVSQRCVYR